MPTIKPDMNLIERAPHERYSCAKVVYMVVVAVVVCSSVTRMPLHMCCTVATRNALHCKVCVLKTRPASNKIIKIMCNNCEYNTR